jgi:hypothetical protein
MLRQIYMNKYKEKSKFDDERFIKEDDEYLLKEMRPVKDTSIKRLPKKKLDKFIDDILTNIKFTKILYASNSQVEIKKYYKTKQSLEKNEKKKKKIIKEKNETSSIVKKRSRREAYIQIRLEVDNYKRNRSDYKNTLEKKNNETYYTLKKEMNNDKNSYFNTIKQNRIKGFRKSFDKLREKLKSLKGNSLIEENTKETETLNDPFYTEDSKIDLPKIKLNINNVFSRLYHNVVLLQNDKNIIPHKRNNSAQILHKNNTTNNINVNNNNHHIPPNPKIKYKLKNVLKSTNGKEFTIKITDEVIKKCFAKYSGGPSVISYLKSQLKKDQFNEKENELREDQVNFYSLITKEGNSFLHIATMENLPELVKYFTDKGANVNIQNLNGDTPLHISAREHFDACTLILLKAKASLDIPNNNNKIPFDYFDEERKKKFGLDKIVIKDNNGKIKN